MSQLSELSEANVLLSLPAPHQALKTWWKPSTLKPEDRQSLTHTCSRPAAIWYLRAPEPARASRLSKPCVPCQAQAELTHWGSHPPERMSHVPSSPENQRSGQSGEASSEATQRAGKLPRPCQSVSAHRHRHTRNTHLWPSS